MRGCECSPHPLICPSLLFARKFIRVLMCVSGFTSILELSSEELCVEEGHVVAFPLNHYGDSSLRSE